MKRNYIGLACSYHDAAIAIVDSHGEVVFAEASERFLQKKRALNCPADDVPRALELIDAYCDPGAELVVSRTWSAGSVAAFRGAAGIAGLVVPLLDRGAAVLDKPPPASEPVLSFTRFFLKSQVHAVSQASAAIDYAVSWAPFHAQIDRVREIAVTGPVRAMGEDSPFPRHAVTHVDCNHHLSHAAAACYSSPYDEAVCAIIDGYGEDGCVSFFAYRDGTLTRIEGRQRSIASIGGIYMMLCAACGFDPLVGEEWKVMGLAAYGRFDDRIYVALQGLHSVDDLRFVSRWDPREYMRVIRQLAAYPAADVAHTGQVFFEDCMWDILTNLANRGISKNLVLGGGCALNSSANGKLLDHTPFASLYVYCAPGDDGNAVGAALHAFYRDHPGERPPRGIASPYLGSEVPTEDVARMLRLGRPPGHRSWPGTVHHKAAELLSEGKIIGWVQGRAELGPRALGNRSILADPRRPDVKDVLNERVKFREEFRPFAPSILHEYGEAYFERYQESPYMERALPFRDEVKSKVPGVVHEDGTGRLQTVKREWNERYYDLIAAFHERTGVPLVLNTSFNVMGKPIIHSVEDAMAVFYTSGLDALVLHDEVIEKT